MLWKLSDVESGFLRADSGNNVSLYVIFMFLSSVTSFEDAEYLGHSLTSKTDENVDQLKEFALENRRSTVSEVVNILIILFGSVHSI